MIAAAVVLLALPAASDVAAGADLWEKAIEYAAAARGWTAGRSVTRVEKLRKSGAVESVEEIWSSFSAAPDGSVEEAIVKVVKDGRDRTEEVRRRKARERDQSRRSGTADTEPGVFEPAAQPYVRRARTDDVRTIDGRACRGYEFTQKTRDGVARGTAWLDDETGRPVELSFTPEPLPSLVKRLSVRIRFEFTPPDRWVAAKIESEGTGGLLFVQREFRTRTTFSHYWRRPAMSCGPQASPVGVGPSTRSEARHLSLGEPSSGRSHSVPAAVSGQSIRNCQGGLDGTRLRPRRHAHQHRCATDPAHCRLCVSTRRSGHARGGAALADRGVSLDGF